MLAARPPSQKELEKAFERACVYANQLIALRPGLYYGITPDELVSPAFERFFASPTALNWDGQRDFSSFMCGVLRNVAFEARRARRKERSVALDDLHESDLPHSEPLVEDQDDFADRVRGCVADDESLKKIVDATLDDIEHNGRNLNQELARATGLTVRQIENDKKRLRRKLWRKMRSELNAKTRGKS